eukprot:scaffold119328_cov18-Prasinocladus_malaysianus.AAC.1
MFEPLRSHQVSPYLHGIRHTYGCYAKIRLGVYHDLLILVPLAPPEQQACRALLSIPSSLALAKISPKH